MYFQFLLEKLLFLCCVQDIFLRTKHDDFHDFYRKLHLGICSTLHFSTFSTSGFNTNVIHITEIVFEQNWNQLKKVCYESPVTAANFPRNASNRCYFFLKYQRLRFFPPIRRYQRKNSVKISTWDSYCIHYC